MRNVGPHILEDKMDEAVTHYINSHQAGEQVHVDTNALALSVPDDGGGRVTVMHSQNFSSPLCRQVSVGEGVEGQWGEELLDAEGRLAALVAHLAQHPRFPHHHHTTHHKVTAGRSDVDASVILDTAPMRLFSAQAMDPQSESITVHVPSLPPLPPLQDMKRCRDSSWFNEKDKTALKSDAPLPGGASPGGERLPSKKSLPHKKRISRKLKRNTGSCTPHQDIVVINCAEVEQDIATAEEILPDSFAAQHQGHLPGDTHHITHEVRPMFICQLCGEFYGDEQLKFYHHLKQHYEPHSTIIIENPVPDLGIDKMTNTCIVDNVAALPDSIVELSLENTVPKTLYHQPMDKHILYSNDKSLNYTGNKVQYSMDKESHDVEKTDLYDTLEDKLGLYSCSKCNKSFRKQKQCEAHIKEVHCNPKIEEMSEFSEPEDLMEGIHVSVEEGAEGGEGEGGDYYGGNIAPHLTVDKGQVHQEHVRQWYIRGGPAPPAPPYCDVCPPTPREDHPPHNLKEEVHTLVQRILDTPESNFPENILPESTDLPPEAPPEPPKTRPPPPDSTKKKEKQYVCTHCSRVFHHRGSLLYHTLSHSAKQQVCRDCGKSFYTPRALTIHRRVHSGDRPYKCEVCGKDFRQWSDLNYHKMSLHSNQKQFKCEFCDKEFARKYSLSVHRRIHTGERNYKCEYCNKTFRASSYRLAHMRIHTGDRPHKCEQCGRSFRAPFDLRRHQLIHERVRNRTDEQKKGKDTKPKAEKNDAKITKPVKKVAVASTAKLPVLKNIEKKMQKNTKKTPKKGAPNITVQNGQLKPNSEYTNNVEVFDTRQEYKYKDGYTDNVVFKEDLAYKIKDYNHFKEEGERDIVLKPFRPDAEDKIRADTDGKIMYCNTSNAKEYTTLVQNSSISQVSLGELRHLERDVRPELQGENIECYFDSFTSLYHIPA